MIKMVNVFIPRKNVVDSVRSLHIKSLTKMLDEINIILSVIHKKWTLNMDKVGYVNHPITLMWKDHVVTSISAV